MYLTIVRKMGFDSFTKRLNNLHIVLSHRPFSQKRHRSIRNSNRMYDPSACDKKRVKEEIKYSLLYPKQCYFDFDFYDVRIIAHYEPPKSAPKIRRQILVDHHLPKNTKPDADNIGKFYLDCMTGIVFPDDNLVTSLSVSKVYSDIDYVEIYIIGKREEDVIDQANLEPHYVDEEVLYDSIKEKKDYGKR